MVNRKNVGTNYREYREFRELSREEMGIQKIIWKFKRSSPYQEDAPSIYKNRGVIGLLMRQSEWSAVTLINKASCWTLHLVV